MTTTSSETTSGGTSQPAPDTALKAARPPVGTGSSPLIGLLLALGLMALGVVGIQEALVRSEAISDTSWTSTALTRADGVRSATWMLVAFIALIVVGVLLLLVALRRRPRKTLTLTANTGVYLRTRDLSRIVESRLDGTDSITHASARTTRKKLRITVTTVDAAAQNSQLETRVVELIRPTLDALDKAPKTAVTVRNEDLS